MIQEPLITVLLSLESGSRPKGGVSADSGEVPSLGGEHIDAHGNIDLTNIKRIPKSFFENMRSGRIAPLDILIVKDGATTGKVSIVQQDFPFRDAAVNEHVFCVRVDPAKASPRYIFQFLRSPQGQKAILLDFRGATVGGISREFATRCIVPLPPLAAQCRISGILDRADALRAKRRAALVELGELVQAIFLGMFGDPVTNPKRWENPGLGTALYFQQYGPRFYNETYTPDGIRIVRITDLDESGELDFSAMPRLAVDDTDLQKYQLRPGDLIFARTGATVGKVALIGPSDPPCIAGAYFITLRFDSAVEPVYARAVLASPSIREIVAKRSRQAAQQNFSGPALRQLPMPIPPIALQREFARRVQAVERLKAVQRASLAEMDALFASLQHRAFRGEL